MSAAELVLGPLLRHVDETTASVWVEVSAPSTVEVVTGDRSWSAGTFTVHGRHYALVEVDGLAPDTGTPYRVLLKDKAGGDAHPVWPPPESAFPPSRLATTRRANPARIAFGSCRTSVPHDRAGNRMHGVDALRTYALAMAGSDPEKWPDLVVFLGDQVYADDTSDAMREFIAARRDIEAEPGTELKDYQEYAHLYQLAWSDPAIRWLLSTLPSLMIFDDHDIRDDWNTSSRWRQRMRATSWWHERIVSGLGSYWVYQHLGNLSPEARADDEIWQEVRRQQLAGGGVDISDLVDRVAARVDEHPEAYRWSYMRDMGESRLVVVDSRAARQLEEGNRSMLDPQEMEWLDQQLTGDVEHLFIGTSLPYLLAPGLHHLEAWNEALVGGAWGRRPAEAGRKMRTGSDLEHWAAFNDGFQQVARMVTEVADGRRGKPPATVTFLSGDVHHSYVSEVDRSSGSRILQAVCSPMRNPLPRFLRFGTALLAYGLAVPMGAVAARSSKVPDPPFSWHTVAGPWYDNNLAVLEVLPTGWRTIWYTGEVKRGDHDRPVLAKVATVDVDARRPSQAQVRGRPWRSRPIAHGRVPRVPRLLRGPAGS